ncbi:peptidase domain-containing ABC transporter [Azospirillum sp.]|uniref:peptidase domain-containing ABC transporter n=1 Tax=Azospirillum sp. TaxID=34012 RepID=UPI002D504913|nr:peptidase domain-containing ABC transporter [Azospirillum sp.]HYD64572.1 peptidase domain-containing ABC transporter [Azospirillum sp.]
MSTTAADPLDEFPHTAVNCLVAIARHWGVDVSVERLVHDHAVGSEEPDTLTLQAMAQGIGLKARKLSLSWTKLIAMNDAFPVIVRLANGNSVILAGIRPAEDGSSGEGAVEVGVIDPLATAPGIIFVGETKFRSVWSGETILLKRRFKTGDENQPFGLRWFLPEILKQRSVFRDIAIAALVLHVIGLAQPVFFQLVIDKVLVHHSEATLVVLVVGVILALTFDAIFSYLRQYLLLFATNKIDIRLATRTYGHLLGLPIGFFETNSAGVITQHMQQTEKIRQFLTGRLFLTMLDSSALFVFVPILFFYSAKLTLVVLAFSALIAAVIVILIGPFSKALKNLYRAEGERQAMLVETIHGMRTVKSLALEPVQKRNWATKAAQAVAMHFKVGQISNLAQALTHFLEKLMLVAVIGLGAHDVFSGALSVGALVAFQMLSGRVSQPLVQIVGLVHEYQETALSVRMLGEVMNRPVEGHGTGGLRPRIRGDIEFEGVTFRYATSPVPALDNIALHIPAGSMFGIVGRSGSGKTTLTRLIQGLYPCQEGLIRFDGYDIREMDLAHMRSSIGVVLQDSFLFRGTIRENIAATKTDATFEEVVAAARIAGAEEFIQRLPQGYDTPIEEGASNLSGGQRQRLAIARALLPRPPILILDEATSALDPESEAIFQKNLAGIAAERTLIIVSHRLSSLVNCDQIIVIDRGRISDQGRHQDLLGRSTIYRNLWNQQMKHAEGSGW